MTGVSHQNGNLRCLPQTVSDRGDSDCCLVWFRHRVQPCNPTHKWSLELSPEGTAEHVTCTTVVGAVWQSLLGGGAEWVIWLLRKLSCVVFFFFPRMILVKNFSKRGLQVPGSVPGPFRWPFPSRKRRLIYFSDFFSPENPFEKERCQGHNIAESGVQDSVCVWCWGLNSERV
jgi:hypothetical protein